jgi:hypothetical protein
MNCWSKQEKSDYLNGLVCKKLMCLGLGHDLQK